MPATLDAKAITEAVTAAVAPLKTELETVKTTLTEVREKAATLRTPTPWTTSGPIGQDSQPYSFVRGLAVCANPGLYADKFKYEAEVARRLKGMYGRNNSAIGLEGGMLVPADTASIAFYAQDEDQATLSAARELRMRVKAFDTSNVDPSLYREKTIGGLVMQNTLSDADGGIMRGFPTLGDLIELQRVQQIFNQVGAQEIGLPPNGMMVLPKQTGGTVAYWANESQAVSLSQANFGKLELQAKKLFVLTKLTGEMIRFVNPNMETMLRNDIAIQAAIAADSAMLYGASNDRIKGLFTYPTATSWSQGTDALLTYSGSGAATNGNVLYPNDVEEMLGVLPDAVQNADNRAWVMRYQLFAKIKTRSADAVIPGDAAGPYKFDLTRELGQKLPNRLVGYPAALSSNITATETKGSGTGLTSLLHGHFPDWIIARFGVMEYLSTNVSDTAITTDTIILRGIQYLDAGARHAASFVRYPALLIQ